MDNKLKKTVNEFKESVGNGQNVLFAAMKDVNEPNKYSVSPIMEIVPKGNGFTFAPLNGFVDSYKLVREICKLAEIKKVGFLFGKMPKFNAVESSKIMSLLICKIGVCNVPGFGLPCTKAEYSKNTVNAKNLILHMLLAAENAKNIGDDPNLRLRFKNTLFDVVGSVSNLLAFDLKRVWILDDDFVEPTEGDVAVLLGDVFFEKTFANDEDLRELLKLQYKKKLNVLGPKHWKTRLFEYLIRPSSFTLDEARLFAEYANYPLNGGVNA